MTDHYIVKRIDDNEDSGLRRLEETANEVERVLKSFGYPVQYKYLKNDRIFCMKLDPISAFNYGNLPEAAVVAINDRIKSDGFVFKRFEQF